MNPIQDQPPPIDNNNEPVADAVVRDISDLYEDPVFRQVAEDIMDRKKLGIQRYGMPLKPFDGRDTLVDAYQEILDAMKYMKKAVIEAGDTHNATDFQFMFEDLLEIAQYLRRRLNEHAP